MTDIISPFDYTALGEWTVIIVGTLVLLLMAIAPLFKGKDKDQ